MNGPQVICADCAEPTSIDKPLCDRCAGSPVVPACSLCALGYTRDEFGQHHNSTGGYVGRCQDKHAV